LSTGFQQMVEGRCLVESEPIGFVLFNGVAMDSSLHSFISECTRR